MKNISINLILDTRRQKKDKTYPIVFRIVFNRKPTSIGTNYSINKTDWDSRHEKIKKSCKKYKDVVAINHELQLYLTKFKAKLLRVDEVSFESPTEVRKFLLGKEEKRNRVLENSFVKFTNQLVDEFKAQGRYGNAKAYDNAILFMRKYYKSDFPFKDLTPKLLKKIEIRFLAHGYSFNGLSFNLRTVRAIYNKAIAAGIIDASLYPFKRHSYEKDKYQIREEKTKKRAITKAILNMIEDYQPKPDTGRYHAKNYFLFSFYCRGINIRDMALLRKANIQDNTLHYRRAKTQYTYDIKLTPKAKAILDLYGYEEKRSFDYLFPMVTRDHDPELLEKDLYNAMRLTNKNLQKIAKELDLSVHLTTYVARHSWATIADKLGIDRRTISQGLGHTSLNTTEIYINDIVSSEDLSNADEIITG
jgi:integrase